MNTSLRGQLFQDCSLAEYTSWRVGGPATRVYKPADLADLSTFLPTLDDDEPIEWLGLGSNTLVRDSGFVGTVIITQGVLKKIETVGPMVLRAEAGVACASLARASVRQGLLGIEFLAGIPGTIGGALRMNAGCFNGETWEFVKDVEVINRRGQIIKRTPDEFDVAYRHVKATHQDEWFVAGCFELQPGDKQQGLEQIRSLLERRAATQPTGEYSCGSVFRNPPGDYAARLIESCGLKGYRVGDAAVSDKHANFIINAGDATAENIEQLIELIAAKVSDECGIQLQREVQIIGIR